MVANKLSIRISNNELIGQTVRESFRPFPKSFLHLHSAPKTYSSEWNIHLIGLAIAYYRYLSNHRHGICNESFCWQVSFNEFDAERNFYLLLPELLRLILFLFCFIAVFAVHWQLKCFIAWYCWWLVSDVI